MPSVIQYKMRSTSARTSKGKNEFSIDTLAKIDEDPLYRESDRGCVLICAADLENKLRDLLVQFFSKASALTKSQYKDLFEYTGPLGTFSSLIKISRAIGLLDNSLYSDLEKIRKIRNNAAHSNRSFSLSDTESSSIIRTMHFDWSKLKRIKRYSLVTKKAGKLKRLLKTKM